MLNQLGDRLYLRIIIPKWTIHESIFLGIPIQSFIDTGPVSLKIAEPSDAAQLGHWSHFALTMKVVDPPHCLCIADFSQIPLGSWQIRMP